MLSRQQSQASPQHHHQAQQQQRLQQQQEQQQQAQQQQAQQTTAPDRSAAQSVFDSTPTPAGAVVAPCSTSGDAALTFTALGAETPQVDSPTLLAAIRTRARLPSDMMQRVHERNVLYLAHCVAHAITDPDFASSMVASVSPTASRKGGPVISGGAGTSSAASADQALEVEGVKAGSSTPRSTVSDASGKPPLSSGRVSRRLCPCCSKMQKEARLKFFYGATVRICESPCCAVRSCACEARCTHTNAWAVVRLQLASSGSDAWCRAVRSQLTPCRRATAACSSSWMPPPSANARAAHRAKTRRPPRQLSC